VRLDSAVARAALFIAALAATACSGARDAPTCPAAMPPSPGQLLYPIPGATGVPTQAGSLLLAGVKRDLYVSLGGPNYTLLTAFPGPEPSPLPEPAAAPVSPASALSGVPYPALAAHTTFTVATVPSVGLTCYFPVGVTLGTFTTR
jgi:hypothetical protein